MVITCGSDFAEDLSLEMYHVFLKGQEFEASQFDCDMNFEVTRANCVTKTFHVVGHATVFHRYFVY